VSIRTNTGLDKPRRCLSPVSSTKDRLNRLMQIFQDGLVPASAGNAIRQFISSTMRSARQKVQFWH